MDNPIKTKAKENGSKKVTSYSYGVDNQQHARGLTKREYFAAMALQGLLSNASDSFAVNKAVKIADELLLELEKRKE